MKVVAKWTETEPERKMSVVELELELKIVGVVAGGLEGIDKEKMVVDGESGQEMECIRCRKWMMVHWLMGSWVDWWNCSCLRRYSLLKWWCRRLWVDDE